MCLHCKGKHNCTVTCVLNSTKKPICNRDSLEISKDILKQQTDEVKNVVRKLQKVETNARKGYRLYTAYDDSIKGETLATVINNDKASARERRYANYNRKTKLPGINKKFKKDDVQKVNSERKTELPEAKHKSFKETHCNPALKNLNIESQRNFKELHLKQIKLYDKIEKDLNRLRIVREQRAEEAASRLATQSEKDELREKLKTKAVVKLSVPVESNDAKQNKKAEQKERALAKKLREQAAKNEIRLNQAKLRDMVTQK